ALMHDAQTVRERFREEELLEWNVRILLQVCNAIHFAHSRGIIHRDLKPENVMVGEFGEVYVVDWGIALSLRDDRSGRMPLARNATDMAGTPVYMAPEMLGGRTSRLCEQTDVYLLGALLYEIVVGHPPHRGETLMELVLEIIDSNPEIPSGVPPELRAVIRHAMDADPAGRFETADQFRIALQGFLQHRDAIALASKAEQQLEKLERMLAAEMDEAGDRDRVYPLFGEARFGFRHALEVWPGCEAAREGLDRALTQMIEFELNGGEPEAARALLSEVSKPPEALTETVEAARAKRREENRSLRALRDDADPSVGRRTRVFLAIIIGTLWCVSPLGEYIWLSYGNAPSHAAATILLGSVFAALLGLGFWARDSLRRTKINRFLVTVVSLAMGSGVFAHGLGWLAGNADVLVTARDQFLTWAVLAAACAMVVDRRLMLPAAGYAGGYALLMFFPTALLPVLVLCNAIMMGTMVRLWFQRGDLEAFNQRTKERRRSRRTWIREEVLGVKRGPAPSEESGDSVVDPGS
ncbi:MAG TPA: serine/threonine protein kinase, partial [Polyangiaceae bacterium]|nr:serine/threonine protein kinase [Polyangiaceae bacterium]